LLEPIERVVPTAHEVAVIVEYSVQALLLHPVEEAMAPVATLLLVG
jgi:hypothetical protein